MITNKVFFNPLLQVLSKYVFILDDNDTLWLDR